MAARAALAANSSSSAPWMARTGTRQPSRTAAGGARAAIERLRAAGVDAGIEVLAGVSHYDTHRFAAPLSRQVEWLRGRCAP